jgi:tetratricopeptide (TPR) repeat protein
MLRYLPLLLAALPLANAAAADALYDLSGRVEPAGRAAVSLYGATSPFTTSTLSGDDGSFTFHRLLPGEYTVAVFYTDRGEARRTIEVGAGTADSHNRITVKLVFQDSDFVVADAMRRRHAVSASQLSIPEKAQKLYEDAHRALSHREAPAAEKSLEEAVEIAPQFSAAWNELGTIAYQTQRFDRAEQCFRQALEDDPRAYEPLVNLGGVLVTVHRTDEALTFNIRAVLARPNDALAQSQLGLTYFQADNFDLALKHLDLARHIDPGHFSCPQLTIAEIYLRRGEHKEAADVMEEFLKYHPDWPSAAKMRDVIAQLRQ